MIRVGFLMADSGDGWLGGTNYRRNLIASILLNDARRIQPVLITAPTTDDALLASFPGVEIVRSPYADPNYSPRKLGKAALRLTGRDFLLERAIARHRIDMLSHSDALGRCSAIPSLVWLPDFQHRRLPEYTRPEQIRRIDGSFRRLIDNSTAIVVSSADAARDLAAFAPGTERRTHVLHFVSGLNETRYLLPRAQLQTAFGLSGPYFHLPNQWWRHKNHGLVIEAVAILKARGISTTVLATGNTLDPRHPQYFPNVMTRIKALGIESMFRVLGVVTHAQLHALIENAVALINPSCFEGWSSTVEESKSLGKRILLSNIPVHREQAPTLGTYFDPASPEQLADAMAGALAAYDPAVDAASRAAAAAALPERARAFGRTYENIVLATIGESAMPDAYLLSK